MDDREKGQVLQLKQQAAAASESLLMKFQHDMQVVLNRDALENSQANSWLYAYIGDKRLFLDSFLMKHSSGRTRAMNFNCNINSLEPTLRFDC